MARLYCKLTLTGFREEPNTVVELLKVAPDFVWAKGDKRNKSAMSPLHEENGLQFDSGANESEELSSHLSKILEKLKKLYSQDIVNELKCDKELSVIVYPTEYVPEIHFDSELLQYMSKMDVSLDVDIIL
tara:strand:+ start:863 stop:1252 length:390 start_codon:yes stop_codon:yes gene_type:complete